MLRNQAELPDFSRMGGINRLDIDLMDQHIRVDIDAQIRGQEGWFDIQCIFSGVCYHRVASDLRYTRIEHVTEDIIDIFEERSDGIAQLLHEKDGWLYLVLPAIGSVTLANPREDKPVLRHFVLTSTFVILELICCEARFEISVSPEQA